MVDIFVFDVEILFVVENSVMKAQSLLFVS